eukprot:389544-Ditylum_brightwellii.AAC.2
MKLVAKCTLHINDLGKDPVRDPGEVATLPKSLRNNILVTKPERFGITFHFDSVNGVGTIIGEY